MTVYKNLPEKETLREICDRLHSSRLVLFLNMKIKQYDLLYDETDSRKYRVSMYDYAENAYQKVNNSRLRYHNVPENRLHKRLLPLPVLRAG